MFLKQNLDVVLVTWINTGFLTMGPKYSFLPSRWTWEGHCGRHWLPLKINTSNILVIYKEK